MRLVGVEHYQLLGNHHLTFIAVRSSSLLGWSRCVLGQQSACSLGKLQEREMMMVGAIYQVLRHRGRKERYLLISERVDATYLHMLPLWKFLNEQTVINSYYKTI